MVPRVTARRSLRLGAIALFPGALFVVAWMGLPGTAVAALSARPYVIAVGHNGTPVPGSETDGEGLRTLRFSDDDAATVYQLYEEAGADGALLATLDADTRRRHPDLVNVARAPTLEELRSAIRTIRAKVEADLRAGGSPEVVFFFSGHGFSSQRGPALALQDGEITSELLYDEIIGPLSVTRLHVVVDACHAEAVVRPRDLQATVVELPPTEAEAYVHRTTLDRYPNVGALVATTRSAQSHEWDEYGAGVFTHQLLSGLRGGADVDGNGLVEYSELAAFLAAANRNVGDPRARLDSVIRPPRRNSRAPLMDLRRLANAGRLRGHIAALGSFYVEDDRGLRILDMHAESGFAVTLVVPAQRTLFLRGRAVELEVRLQPGEILSLDGVEFRTPSLSAKGALESALRRGLFATGFGPGYYLGYVDRVGEALPVVVPSNPADSGPPPRRSSWRTRASWLSVGASVALTVGALASGTAAFASYRDVDRAVWEADALAARDRYVVRRDIALVSAAGALATGVLGLVLSHRGSGDDVVVGTTGTALGLTGSSK